MAAAALIAMTLPVAATLSGQQRVQQNTPRVGFVFPAGGRQGTTIEVTVGGQFLDRVALALASGSGLTATVLRHDKPLTQREMTELREKALALQKNAADPAAAREMVAIRDRIAESVRRNLNPAIAERVVVAVAIAADAQPGPRTLRLVTPLGVSTPLVFDVDALPELLETEAQPESDAVITLPAIVNGRLVPRTADGSRAPARPNAQNLVGDVDRFRFAARKGQSLVAAVRARDLQPYIADAVPGWFQAAVTLRDDHGREVAYADDHRFRPDPVLHYEIPRDGDYTIEIKDALYRGREDFVYRLAIGELPFITSIFPLGVAAGAKTGVELTGWNLPADRRIFDAAGFRPGVHSFHGAGGSSFNRLWIAVGDLPERLEREPNESTRAAQPLSLPVIVNGRIAHDGDQDSFRFDGRAGDRIVAEISARALDSPLDSRLELVDSAGNVVASNDDCDAPRWGLVTHQADSMLMARLPADGTFFVRVSDVSRTGGPEYAYRLRLGPPQPDFELRVAPSAIVAGVGGVVPIEVAVLRKDGFAGDVTLSLSGGPAGARLSGHIVPAGSSDIRATVTVPPLAPGPPMRLRLEGSAEIAGRTITREAVPADVRTQAFAYEHLVPAAEFLVAAAGRGGIRVPPRIASPLPVRIPAGGVTTIRVVVPPAYQTLEHVELDLSKPPDGVTLGTVRLQPGAAEIEVRADPAKVKPGMRGTLIIAVSGERAAPSAAAPAAAPLRRRVPLGFLPAIPFVILPGR